MLGKSTIAVRLPWRPSARLATPVLVVSALLCGAGVGSAVFATLWQREASARRTAEESLASSSDRAATLEARVAVLRRELAASRKTAAAAGRAVARGDQVVTGLARGARPLVAGAGSLESQAGSLTQRAHQLSGLIASLDKDLASLDHYVGGAGSATLDPAFLESQLRYLTPSLSRVGKTSAALAAEVGTYSQTVQEFADRLSAYANTIPAHPHR